MTGGMADERSTRAGADLSLYSIRWEHRQTIRYNMKEHKFVRVTDAA